MTELKRTPNSHRCIIDNLIQYYTGKACLDKLNKPLVKLTYHLTVRRENLHAPYDVFPMTNQMELHSTDLHIPNMADFLHVLSCYAYFKHRYVLFI